MKFCRKNLSDKNTSKDAVAKERVSEMFDVLLINLSDTTFYAKA